MDASLPFNSQYIPDFLSTEKAAQYKEFCDASPVHCYGYRGTQLKRAPKTEWYLDEPVLYRWGQHKEEYKSGQPMPPLLVELTHKIHARFGERPNHAIMIRYSHGTNHFAPLHKDKQEGVDGPGAKDMTAGTSFYAFSFGTPRAFHLVDSEGVVVFNEALPQGSLLAVDAETNKHYKHAIPKDKQWEGVRYSIIFRTIRTVFKAD